MIAYGGKFFSITLLDMFQIVLLMSYKRRFIDHENAFFCCLNESFKIFLTLSFCEWMKLLQIELNKIMCLQKS